MKTDKKNLIFKGPGQGPCLLKGMDMTTKGVAAVKKNLSIEYSQTAGRDPDRARDHEDEGQRLEDAGRKIFSCRLKYINKATGLIRTGFRVKERIFFIELSSRR
jgi:hypothetical protein